MNAELKPSFERRIVYLKCQVRTEEAWHVLHDAMIRDGDLVSGVRVFGLADYDDGFCNREHVEEESGDE